jgi:hypothetical protein
MNDIDQEKSAPAHRPSDGSELVPAEVQANTRKETGESFKEPMGAGYRVDDEGIVNNYAIEPKMYDAKYPSSKQQRRYIFLGAVAVLLVALVLWIAFVAS